MKDEFKSLSLAVVLSFIAIYSVNYFFGINPKSVAQQQMEEVAKEAHQAEATVENALFEGGAETEELADGTTVLTQDSRLKFENNSVLMI